MGFCLVFTLECPHCKWKDEFETSYTVKKNQTPGRSLSNVNVRSIVAFREIGKGHRALQSFARCMNIAPPVALKSYNNINSKLHGIYNDVAAESTSRAAKETQEKISPEATEMDITNCQVSLDGSWQKRGHVSINGVVTVMSKENAKCLDTHVMSKKCKGCDHWEKRKAQTGYDDWKMNHVCQTNHTKSSGAMEAAGAVTMFKRSIEKNKLRYTSYIGDGDTSSFSEVVQSKPYGDDVEIDKKECVGHVQKRMGTRLRTLRINKKVSLYLMEKESWVEEDLLIKPLTLYRIIMGWL